MRPHVTIADVARDAGVSAQTVSRVLNNKGEISAATRQTVLETIKRLGYRPNGVARSLVTRRTQTLGLIVPDIVNPYFAEVARGAEDGAVRAGYNMFLCNTIEHPDREEAVLNLLADRRVDGVVVCAPRLPDERLWPALQLQRAVVVVNRATPAEIGGSVRVDAADGARRAVEHLLARGRGVIGLLAGPPNSHGARDRRRGFAAALDAAGRPADASLIVPCPPFLEGGDRACRALLEARSDIDALFCYNDLVAVGALQACAALGIRVPDDVAIIGFDDILLARFVSPALTTLRVAKYDLGAAAVRMLLERIEGRREEREVLMTPELIVRASAPQS